MKFIPILFSTPMVQAIIEGRKTMTRRVMKPRLIESDNCFHWNRWINQPFNNPECCPYGQVGDVLWVRETFFGYNEEDENKYLYFADSKDSRPFGFSDSYCANEWGISNKEIWPKWKPSLFMPKAACRIFLKITEIRVKRLQDISEEDAIREGIDSLVDHRLKSEPIRYASYCDFDNPKDPALYTSCPINSFETLWQSINGKDSWEANPWVWVICFERIEKPTDFL